MKRAALFLGLVCLSSLLHAQVIPTGTWVKRDTASKSQPFLMTVELSGSGVKITYQPLGPNTPANAIMVLQTQFDGKEVPVLVQGKPSGETMAIKKVDSRHTFTVIRMRNKEFGTSKCEVSPDGKVLKVENEMSASASPGPREKSIEYWDKQ